MKTLISALAFSFFQIFTVSALAGISAKRLPQQDFRSLAAPYFSSQTQNGYNPRSLPEEQIVEWESLEVLQNFFEKMRDERFLETETSFARRISWLYPDDGCYTRAALMIEKAREFSLPIPNRVFLYGNLKVVTPHSPQNYVTWWYHTAPIVKIDGKNYVLDAALNSDHPLLLEDWIHLQTGNGDYRELRFCTPFTYDPGHSCTQSTLDTAPLAYREIKKFLRYEWSRQEELGRDPYEILGEKPPWNQTLLNMR